MRVRVLEGVRELEALAPAWRELFARSRASPFQSPDWLVPFARHLASGAVQAIAFEKDGALAAILPLERRDGRTVLLGSGVSDYLDVLVDPSAARDVLALLTEILAPLAPCEFEQLPPGSCLASLDSPPGFRGRLHEGEPCPVLPLGRTLEESVPGPRMKKLRQARRQAERSGGMSFDGVDPQVLLEELFRLHAERWAERGESGVLSATAVQSFHREVAGRFSARGMLCMRQLALGGERAAVFYGFTHHETVFFYLSGFAPGSAPRSPGLLLLGAVIEEAAGQGLARFDFLRGREPYKYAWGARDVVTTHFHLDPAPGELHPDRTTPQRQEIP